MFGDALCFARMNGTSIFKRVMRIMKEDRALPGLPPEGMECKLWREAESEGVQRRKHGPALTHDSIALAVQPHSSLVPGAY